MYCFQRHSIMQISHWTKWITLTFLIITYMTSQPWSEGLWLGLHKDLQGLVMSPSTITMQHNVMTTTENATRQMRSHGAYTKCAAKKRNRSDRNRVHWINHPWKTSHSAHVSEGELVLYMIPVFLSTCSAEAVSPIWRCWLHSFLLIVTMETPASRLRRLQCFWQTLKSTHLWANRKLHS